MTTVGRRFWLALAFLTAVPVPVVRDSTPEDIAGARGWYPVVGLLLGGLLGGWAVVVVSFLPVAVAAFVVLTGWVLLTGALHLDGWCDLCDGLCGGWTAERRLAIMKDPHLGTFGLAGGVLLLLGKYATLTELLRDPLGPWAVGTAVAGARCMILVMAAGSRYPRADGTGKLLIEATKPWEAWLAAFLALVFIGTGLGWSRVGVAVPALLSIAGLKSLCKARLGGSTGDCLGAAVELAELLILLGAVTVSLPAAPR